jgi:hypothetical protein
MPVEVARGPPAAAVDGSRDAALTVDASLFTTADASSLSKNTHAARAFNRNSLAGLMLDSRHCIADAARWSIPCIDNGCGGNTFTCSDSVSGVGNTVDRTPTVPTTAGPLAALRNKESNVPARDDDAVCCDCECGCACGCASTANSFRMVRTIDSEGADS